MTADLGPVTPPDAMGKAKEEFPAELTLSQAMSIAVKLHRAGHTDHAEPLYRRILEAAPDYPDALHFLGVLTHQRGQSDAAVALIQKSIALDPDHPDRYNNLGNVLVEMGRLPEATDAFRKAIALQPEHADAYSNLGTVLRAQRRFEDAAAAYQKAIDLNPRHVDAHNNYGNLLSSRGLVAEAIAYYCKGITLGPADPRARKLLGIAYYTLGQIDAAAQVFREWLEQEPGNPVAVHMLAACSGENVPHRASDAYVESTFDAFAASFDAKLEVLGYRAPQLVTEALGKAYGPPAKNLRVLDAGCGTGLCGPLIAPFASHLAGIDLSGGMLEKARARSVYDELSKAELKEYLAARSGVFDLVVSADTLCYFGSLEGVLEAAFRALRPDGLLIFTVEEVASDSSADGFHLNPHGRYSHSRRYLERALPAAGFILTVMEPAVLRTEGGRPVSGLVLTGSKGR